MTATPPAEALDSGQQSRYSREWEVAFDDRDDPPEGPGPCTPGLRLFSGGTLFTPGRLVRKAATANWPVDPAGPVENPSPHHPGLPHVLGRRPPRSAPAPTTGSTGPAT